ncbi:hypothetical protein NEIFLAOT_01504 [Neisseria flavescens NRL30031/H210]|uniref:Uncharacterized protein n=1 Tax=Neisseria flavescens NRL30031/H210 TaxID=546264 RepID=C0ENG9_NEIFL|nr:hypothetical protein NEIFLAOT_01504 [Neisseria flavescens NRL30031/H210]
MKAQLNLKIRQQQRPSEYLTAGLWFSDIIFILITNEIRLLILYLKRIRHMYYNNLL